MKKNTKSRSIYIRTFGYAAFFGLAFWVADGVFRFYFLHQNLRFLLLEGPETLLDSIALKVPPQAVLSRLSFLFACFASAMLVATYLRRYRLAEEELRNLNAALESRVAERTAQLEATNRELESFSYSVSHDLKSPLRSIREFSLAIMEEQGHKLDQAGKDYFERILAAEKRMEDLIEDLLKLSQLTYQPMCAGLVDLSRMASEIIDKLRTEHSGRIVEVRIEPGLTVNGDRHLIRILLENLLSNAWKFTSTKPHAKIELTSAEIPGNGMEIGKNRKVFVLSDNGIGFDEAYAHNLFVPFQRLHSGRQFDGNGIGLATVERIVLRHGGTVWAEGSVGEGARFYFAL